MRMFMLNMFVSFVGKIVNAILEMNAEIISGVMS